MCGECELVCVCVRVCVCERERKLLHIREEGVGMASGHCLLSGDYDAHVCKCVSE